MRGPARIVVFTGLRGERRIGRSLVLRCGLTGTQRSLDCLRTHFRWGKRASGGARILVWKQPLQGVGDDPERVKSSTLSPPSFPTSAAHPHPSLCSPSDFLVPPPSTCVVLTTREQFSFVSSRLLPLPWNLAGSLFPIQQDLGTHPHLNR